MEGLQTHLDMELATLLSAGLDFLKSSILKKQVNDLLIPELKYYNMVPLSALKVLTIDCCTKLIQGCEVAQGGTHHGPPSTFLSLPLSPKPMDFDLNNQNGYNALKSKIPSTIVITRSSLVVIAMQDLQGLGLEQLPRGVQSITLVSRTRKSMKEMTIGHWWDGSAEFHISYDHGWKPESSTIMTGRIVWIKRVVGRESG